jgi:hypothetical protein
VLTIHSVVATFIFDVLCEHEPPSQNLFACTLLASTMSMALRHISTRMSALSGRMAALPTIRHSSGLSFEFSDDQKAFDEISKRFAVEVLLVAPK